MNCMIVKHTTQKPLCEKTTTLYIWASRRHTDPPSSVPIKLNISLNWCLLMNRPRGRFLSEVLCRRLVFKLQTAPGWRECIDMWADAHWSVCCCEVCVAVRAAPNNLFTHNTTTVFQFKSEKHKRYQCSVINLYQELSKTMFNSCLKTLNA